MGHKRLAVDTSKSVFTVHGIDAEDQPVLRRNFSRGAFESVFENSISSHGQGRMRVAVER